MTRIVQIISFALLTISFLLPTQAKAIGTLTGVISDLQGDPIAGIRVSVVREQCNTLSHAGGVETNSTGTFVFDELDYFDQNLYLIVWRGIGYTPVWYNGEATGSEECSDAVVLDVANGETLAGLNMNLAKPHWGAVSGLVTDVNNNPIPHMQLDFFRNKCDFSSASSLGSCHTDSEGVFFKNGLAAGTVYIRTKNRGDEQNEWWNNGDGNFDCSGADPVSVEGAVITTGIDFVLAETGITVSGTINFDGAPYDKHVQLHIHTGRCYSGEWIANFDNLPDYGSFSSNILAPGTYYITALTTEDDTMPRIHWNSTGGTVNCSQAAPVVIESGEDFADLDFTLQQGGKATGVVYDQNDEPLASASVYPYAGYCGNGKITPTTTDENGVYEIPRLPLAVAGQGPYIMAYKAGYTLQWWEDGDYFCDRSNVLPIIIGNTSENIDFKISTAGMISGTVLRNGQPLAGVIVYAYGAPCGMDVLGYSVSAPDGSYRIDYIPTGNAYIQAYRNAEENQWWGTPAICEGAQPVSVEHGLVTADINFNLESADSDDDGDVDGLDLQAASRTGQANIALFAAEFGNQ